MEVRPKRSAKKNRPKSTRSNVKDTEIRKSLEPAKACYDNYYRHVDCTIIPG